MYNSAIATSDTNIIVNSVVVLFIMEIDEYIFAALEAINEKWTKHASDSESSSDTEEKEGAIEELKEEVAVQKAQIASQQEELMRQKDQMARQNSEITMLREAVQKMQDSLVGVATSSESIGQCAAAAGESLTVLSAESEDNCSGGVLRGAEATNEIEDEFASDELMSEGADSRVSTR